MAQFGVYGLDKLMLSLQEVASLPTEVQDEMLNAGADVLIPAQKKKIRDYGILDTGTTERSINKGKPKTSKGSRVIDVTATGSRKRGNTITKNTEILYINEFGKKGQPARPAIRDANEECADEMVAAEMVPYDKYLKSKDL